MKLISKLCSFIRLCFGDRAKANPETQIESNLVNSLTDNDYIVLADSELEIPTTLCSDIPEVKPTEALSFKNDSSKNDSSIDDVSWNASNKDVSHTTTEDASVEMTDSHFCDLLENICYAIADFDEKAKIFSNQSGENVYKYIRSRLIDRICISGASLITDEETFDLLRHIPAELQEIPEEGCHISKMVRPGVEYDGKVFLKAIVNLN